MAYTDPFSLRVLKAMTATLQTITPANGYVHDLSAAVFRGRDLFGDDDPVPMLAILEAPDELGQLDSPRGSSDLVGPWELLIQGFVDDDIDNPTDPGHYLLADVKQCLATERRKASNYEVGIFGMKGRVDNLEFSRGVVRPADGISGKAYFWIKVILNVIEDVTLPYE